MSKESIQRRNRNLYENEQEKKHMDTKLKRLRRTFAEQLTKKHQLKLFIPDENASESSIECFIHQLIELLNEKLRKQNEQIERENLDEFSLNSPLKIQRKQLQKDLDDFKILEKRNDFYRLNQIIERIEHMSMFNMKTSIQIEEATPIPSLKPISTLCSYRILCFEFVQRLNWPNDLFAPDFDRCFCKQCYPLTMPSVCQMTSDHSYPMIIPRNWMKFGLKVDQVQAKLHQIWDRWAISYHGTLPSAALSMIKHRQICLPGDKLSDGTQLNIRSGHIQGENAFFTSPTIRYACQDHYATPLKFTSETDKCVYWAKIVLRCRQMPKTFVVQSQTLNNGGKMNEDFCDWISNDEIEWKTDQRGTVIFDGLCIHLTKFIEQIDRQQTNFSPSKFVLKIN